MKKISAVLIAIFMVSLMFAVPVLGEQKIQLSEKQINKLRDFGMPENDIANLTQEKLRSFMRQLSSVPASKENLSTFGYSEEDIEKHKKLIKDKNLDEKKMRILGNLGFTGDDIIRMPEEEINRVLSKYDVGVEKTAASYTAYSKPIPYFGSNPGETTYFESSVYVSDSAISSYCESAMDFAEYVFNRTYNYATTQGGQNIRFSYFLFGEKDPGIHEGLDVTDVNSATRTIRCATPGDIVGPIGGTYGQVRIYDSYLDETIVYLHMQDIPQTIINKTKTTTSVGDTIGNQGKAGVASYHLHVQALDGRYTSSTIPTGTDYVLSSRIPYWYITYWI